MKLTKEIVESLFPGAKELMNFHYKVLDKLNLWTPKNDTLNEIFVSLPECYEAYLKYGSNHSAAYHILTKDLLKKNKYFSQFYQKLCKEFKGVSFDTFMISPIQRVPRYLLYLKDLLKHTYKENMIYGNYQKGLNEVKKVLNGINEHMKEYEKYIQPTPDLKNFQLSLKLGYRNGIAEYDMYLVNGELKPNNTTKFKVIVFTDLLLVLKNKFYGYQIITTMRIDSGLRILPLPHMKYFSDSVKITNDDKCLILRPEVKKGEINVK